MTLVEHHCPDRVEFWEGEEIDVADDGVHKKPEMFGTFNPSIDEVPGSDGVEIIDIRLQAVENFCSFS